MNFFKSVFADDPDPPASPPSDHESPSSSPPSPNSAQPHEPTTPHDDPDSDPDSNPTAPSPSWGFGGLIKTLQVKSDWIETYRRDLKEFGSGLKKETEVLREVAGKAVKDLPSSIDIESVGHAIESIGSTVWNSTADIISHGKESLLAPDNDYSDGFDTNSFASNSNVQSVHSGRYSRFDAQLRALQCDVNTYVDEPDDVNDYNKWKSGFNLEEMGEEIEGLMKANESIDGMYKRVVPNTVDHDEFWARYYYRVYRLKQAENVRAKLVKRAISTEDEEELSWDVDEEEEDEVKASNEGQKEDDEEKNVEEDKLDEDSHVKSSESANERVEISDKVEDEEKKSNVIESVHEELSNKEVKSEVNDVQLSKKSEKVASEGKTESCKSSKDSDVSVVSTQPSPEEDDMGWDEIEDISSGDEKKVSHSEGSNRDELRKRLSAADEDKDLSWDIEDDD